MAAIKLEPHQIKRVGKYPAPDLVGYESLHFHYLTKDHSTPTYFEWGKELTIICESRNLPYYYLVNDFGIKINVYPENIIEEWWESR